MDVSEDEVFALLGRYVLQSAQLEKKLKQASTIIAALQTEQEPPQYIDVETPPEEN